MKPFFWQIKMIVVIASNLSSLKILTISIWGKVRNPNDFFILFTLIFVRNSMQVKIFGETGRFTRFLKHANFTQNFGLSGSRPEN